MQDGTYPSRYFATLGPLELQPPFTNTHNRCFHISFLCLSIGQTSDQIDHFSILLSPVFLVNSRFAQLYDTWKVHLLPKLRCKFAEFLWYFFTKSRCNICKTTRVGLYDFIFLKQLLFDFKSKYFVPKYYSSSNIQLTINSRIYLCFRNSWPSLF